MNKKILTTSTVILFLGLVFAPSIHANDSGLPDLVIIGMDYRMFGPSTWDTLRCDVANHGDAVAEGEIILKITVRFLLFGMIPIGKEHSYSNLLQAYVLNPGYAIYIDFADSSDFPPWGLGLFSSWRVHCVVNPGYTIPESNYQNNYYTQTIRMSFGWPYFI